MSSWFGWLGGSSSGVPSEVPATSIDASGTPPELKLHTNEASASSSESTGFNLSDLGFGSAPSPSVPQSAYPPTPVLALDQIKSAGIPLNRGMSPYLQLDPKMFANTQPQYIMPDGGTTGKGKFEFALGYIGWAVGTGYFVGCARGAIPELFNPETRLLTGKPWMTRLVNATVKHGSGYAQPAGTVVFMYSALEIGIRPAATGGASGLLLAALWVLAHPDSRQRVFEMFGRS